MLHIAKECRTTKGTAIRERARVCVGEKERIERVGDLNLDCLIHKTVLFSSTVIFPR